MPFAIFAAVAIAAPTCARTLPSEYEQNAIKPKPIIFHITEDYHLASYNQCCWSLTKILSELASLDRPAFTSLLSSGLNDATQSTKSSNASRTRISMAQCYMFTPRRRLDASPIHYQRRVKSCLYAIHESCTSTPSSARMKAESSFLYSARIASLTNGHKQPLV